MSIIRAKIDLKKILTEYVYKGEKGNYIDVTLLENRDGVDRFGNNFMVVQDLGKDARTAGKKGPILGNAKYVGTGQPAPRDAEPKTDTYTHMKEKPPARSATQSQAEADQEVPF